MKTLILLPAFFIGNFIAANASGISISLGNQNSECKTELIFADGATSGFDKKIDQALKEIPGNNLNYIYSMDEKGKRMFQNYCPRPTEYFSVQMQISIHQAGAFDLLLEGEQNDLKGIDFSLTDVL